MTADRALVDKIDKKVLRAIRQQMDGLSLRDCLALRFLARIILIIPSVIYGDPEESNTPNSTAASALVHDDLVASNILIDENYRPKGFRNPSSLMQKPLLKLTQIHQLVYRETPAPPLRLQATSLPYHRSQPLRHRNHGHPCPPRQILAALNAPRA